MNLLFTICGRAGSKGLKNKNLKELNGIPLIYYAISTIRLFMDRHPGDRVSVALNTDSMQLKELVNKQTLLEGIRFIEREKSHAGDQSAKVDVIKDTYLSLKEEGAYDAVVDLDITSPMRRVSDIEGVLEEYQRKDDCDLVFSVVPARRSPYFNMVEKKQCGCYGKVCRSGFTARQQAPEVYEMNASIYAYRPSFLESELENPITDYRCGISVMPDFLVLDIDSEEDFEMMGLLHRHFCRIDPELNTIYELAHRAV